MYILVVYSWSPFFSISNKFIPNIVIAHHFCSTFADCFCPFYSRILQESSQTKVWTQVTSGSMWIYAINKPPATGDKTKSREVYPRQQLILIYVHWKKSVIHHHHLPMWHTYTLVTNPMVWLPSENFFPVTTNTLTNRWARSQPY